MLGLIGDEWSLLIIQQALQGSTRYGEFSTGLPISNAVLTGRLRALTEEGLLERHVYQRNPDRAEYLTTPRSRSLWPVLVAIWAWERRWADHPLPVLRHGSCGRACAPDLACAACSAVVTIADLRVRWGPSGSWPRSMPTASTRRRAGTSPMFAQTMSVFGNRWSAALLIAAFLGATRFGEFEERLGAPPASIAERLRTFRANGIVAQDNYLLTTKGQALLAVIITALQWGQQWFVAPEGDAVQITHRACGQPFQGQLICDQCGVPLRGPQIQTG